MFKKLNNSKYSLISLYVIVVAAVIITIYAFIDNVPYFFDLVIEKLEWILAASKPIIIAIVFAYLLDPVVRFFERMLSKFKFFNKRPNKAKILSVLIVLFITIAVVSAIISILVYTLTKQLRLANFDDIVVIAEGYINNINNFYNTAMNWLESANIRSEELQTYLKDAAMYLLEQVKNGSGILFDSLTNISSFFTKFFITVVIIVYLLIDGRMVMKYVGRISEALFSTKLDNKLKGLVKDADIVFSGYIRGQFMDAFVMLLLISIGLSIIGIKFSVLIGIFAGVGNLIPYLGPIVAYGGVILVSIFTGEWKLFFIAIIYLIIVQAVDGNIIGPKLLSNSISVHPLLVIISIMFGSAIGGLLGMLLAVPVGALLKVLFMRYIDKRIEEKHKIEFDESEESKESILNEDEIKC